MKAQSLLILILLCLAGCGAFAPSVPAPTVETQGTTFPTLPLPTKTPLPTATPAVPVATPPAPSATAIPAATQVPARQAPLILGEIKLNELPGEGRAPSALALLGEELVVANRETANLGYVMQDKVRSFLTLDANPSALVADQARKRIYASSYETPTIYMIENERVVKQVKADGRVNALALDGDTLYVGLDNDAIIERYDANTLEKRDQLKLSQGFGVSDLVLDKPRGKLYAAEYGRAVGVDLNAFKELNTLEIPYLYSKIAVNPGDGSVWGGGYDENTSQAYLVGFATDGQEIARLPLGSDLQAAAFDDQNRLYVLDRFDNLVYVVQTPQAELVAAVAVNLAPSDAVFDAARHAVYVSNLESDNVSVIETGELRVTLTIALANTITALAANPTRKRIYAANAGDNLIYVIENDSVVGRVSAGSHPLDLAVDPSRKRLYVAGGADGVLLSIDEDSLEITAGEFITRFLSSVAADDVNQKLFAGSSQVNPESLLPETFFYAQGLTIASQTTLQYERVNPTLKKLYGIASNGVPGSNSRVTLYSFLYDNLHESHLMGSTNGGNTTALAIDPATNRVYAASSHPLAYTNGLDAFDGDDTLIQSLALDERTNALAVNPTTHHLFLAHAMTSQPTARARDNTVEILDTRTLGRIVRFDVPNEPWRMTVLDDRVYVARYRDGVITIIGDAAGGQPDAPTPTATRTAFPSVTPTPASAPSATATLAPTVVALIACVNPVPVRFAPFQETVDRIGSARLGCTRDLESENDQFAYQPLEHGFMFDDFGDPRDKHVTVFFPDGTYKVFADTWEDTGEDKICPEVPVPAGKWRPKRGFGSVWCNVAEVKALGPGLEEEHSATVTQQPFGNAGLWYTPQRGVIVLWADGTWE